MKTINFSKVGIEFQVEIGEEARIKASNLYSKYNDKVEGLSFYIDEKDERIVFLGGYLGMKNDRFYGVSPENFTEIADAYNSYKAEFGITDESDFEIGEKEEIRDYGTSEAGYHNAYKQTIKNKKNGEVYRFYERYVPDFGRCINFSSSDISGALLIERDGKKFWSNYSENEGIWKKTREATSDEVMAYQICEKGQIEREVIL